MTPPTERSGTPTIPLAKLAPGNAPRRHSFLYLQVLAAITLGVVIGHTRPELGVALQPLGEGFIRLIKMLIAPVIFTTVVAGLAGMGDLKRVGRVGGKALLYFEIVSTLALVTGMIVANVFTPGQGMHIPLSSLNQAAVSGYAHSAETQSVALFFLHLIPNTFVGAFADGNILQILLLAILFGLALGKVGEPAQPLLNFINEVAGVVFVIVGFVTRLAPIGALGAMGFTVGKYGLGSLQSLLGLLACVYLTCFAFIVIVLGGIARWHGFSLWKIIRLLREELLIVLGTSSSESVLPALMQKLQHVGASRSVVGLVVPSGYSFNLDGTSIYITLAALFIAQATDTSLSLTQQVGLLGVALVTSKGAAGITGSGFVTLAATLAAANHHELIVGMTLILGIDRFMSEARAITNFIGNAVATLVVAKWENALDATKAEAVLA